MGLQSTPATALPSAGSALMHATQRLLSADALEQPSPPMRSFELLGVPITVQSLQSAIELVACWAAGKARTRLVTFTNVHMLTEGHARPAFRAMLRQTDLNCPDGMPLVWVGKLLGGDVSRVCGPEFFEQFFASTARDGLRHFFYGGNEGVAARVAAELTERYPDLQVAGVCSPPFRALSAQEDAAMVAMINNANADLVWVCLGCPKQETWIFEHRDKLKPCVLLAVGMVFDILVGEKRRAPQLFCDHGLEWLYRLLKEPGRLGSRYFKSNGTFVYLLLAGLSKSALRRLTFQRAL